MKCCALVTAGGTGTRMGSDVPKQYLELAGVPILARTVAAFHEHEQVHFIVVTVPPGDEERCSRDIVGRYGLSKVREIVAGGATRQESVYNGLQFAQGADLVAIHDGARPLVSPEIISKTILAAGASGGALAGVPVGETVKRQRGSHLETIPRGDLWLAHTPQTFRTELIVQAHREAMDDGFAGTDDASLVERLGHPVTMVNDSPSNIKITTPEDLAVARFLFERS